MHEVFCKTRWVVISRIRALGFAGEIGFALSFLDKRRFWSWLGNFNRFVGIVGSRAVLGIDWLLFLDGCNFNLFNVLTELLAVVVVAWTDVLLVLQRK